MTPVGSVAVLKFGGSSFAAPEAYTELARALRARIESSRQRLAVVVSAMPGETERLRERLHEVAPYPGDDRVAGLLTLADTVSAQLLAAALHRLGLSTTVLAGHETGFTTDETFMWARLERIDPEPLRRALASHEVVVVPGGQAADGRARPTWLGKNSSDLSAVAAAVALGAAQCEIHSDVEGIHSCDPNQVSGTRLLREVSYADATAMSRHGAKVLHHRAVRLAERHGIEIRCRHNKEPFTPGTVIGPGKSSASAVVLNLRSRVLEYPDDSTADLAHRAFRTDGVQSLRLTDGPRVAVIGGYADQRESQLRHGVDPGRTAGVPVTALHGGRGVVHTAGDEAAAVRLAQRLHDGPGPSPSPARV
ncbi:aspartate kinase (plasmid) [Streptomyces sp. NBC_01591]|uniref:amino acid kinase family protein n=1 Tax=Streptomyces sp. NBC_01591 TaxID=2975888 RepID=UPI002DD8C3F0|nr:aspartate kinase [Streptomyces sp. NBC_01591]WSD73885.1 aspartate kinase [Streptomyces sp. NBC_01591]